MNDNYEEGGSHQNQNSSQSHNQEVTTSNNQKAQNIALRTIQSSHNGQDFLKNEAMQQDEDEEVDQQNQHMEFSSSFFSQSFANRLINNRLLNGFDDSDCKINEEMVQLSQLVHNEKCAPELLPYQLKLVSIILKRINN